MIQHLRSNVVAYLALFVALGGTGAYAASKITSGDIKDDTIKGKDIRTGQVAGSDLRDGSATGDDVADGSLDGADIEDGRLTGADIADKSIGGGKIDPATKVPNADMLDGHGSTRYGVGLQMGVARDLNNGQNPTFRYPAGITDSADDGIKAVSPEELELRDFTARLHDTGAATSVNVEFDGAGGTPLICQLSGNSTCHLASNVQHAIPDQGEWSLKFSSTAPNDGDYVTYSYRAVR